MFRWMLPCSFLGGFCHESAGRYSQGLFGGSPCPDCHHYLEDGWRGYHRGSSGVCPGENREDNRPGRLGACSQVHSLQQFPQGSRREVCPGYHADDAPLGSSKGICLTIWKTSRPGYRARVVDSEALIAKWLARCCLDCGSGICG